MDRYWVYHPKHAAKIVDGADEYYKHLADGWFDNPAKCHSEVKNEIETDKGLAANEDNLVEIEQVKRRGRPPKQEQ